MLQWLRAENLCTFDKTACERAARAGQLAALQYLRREGCDWDEDYIACFAALSGSIEVVDWLRQQQGIRINGRVLSWAAGAGQTALCQHLLSKGCEMEAYACFEAARFGQIGTLRWLREQGCPWNVSEVCTGAACGGYLDIFDYVIEQGEVLDAELSTDALNWTGVHNRLQAAQWLRQHGAQWPAVLRQTVEFCTMQWGSDTLAWARAEGCTSPTTA
eukprot:12108-Heterococcus_DN1.PRE.5